jgi:hypothetical protein
MIGAEQGSWPILKLILFVPASRERHEKSLACLVDLPRASRGILRVSFDIQPRSIQRHPRTTDPLQEVTVRLEIKGIQ